MDGKHQESDPGGKFFDVPPFFGTPLWVTFESAIDGDDCKGDPAFGSPFFIS